MLDMEKLERRAARAAKKFGLNDEEVKKIQNAAHAVYDEISADMPPENKRSMTCKRSTIIEVSLDAGRLQQRLKHPPYRESKSEMTPAMEKALGIDANYKLLIDLVGPAFPYEHYEVAGECV